ncbi:hypothetical protein GYMLUDRAFT_594646 [Collybiopsis luxurians FD-317 M1]|uniref:Uncharacterized protein n=1 Tax=Collybiopsis luxurians FD-317 M1 TaxID=944289 RepID=A0A0D0CE26_9AGAR|nr:hypothetical protein GYMLUDRAFT_594646 [Collybiopsis luxurians FD-317 M1]
MSLMCQQYDDLLSVHPICQPVCRSLFEFSLYVLGPENPTHSLLKGMGNYELENRNGFRTKKHRFSVRILLFLLGLFWLCSPRKKRKIINAHASTILYTGKYHQYPFIWTNTFRLPPTISEICSLRTPQILASIISRCHTSRHKTKPRICRTQTRGEKSLK